MNVNWLNMLFMDKIPEGYIEFSEETLEIYTDAILSFKNSAISILTSLGTWKMFLYPDIDTHDYEWFSKKSFILTRETSIPWNFPR